MNPRGRMKLWDGCTLRELNTDSRSGCKEKKDDVGAVETLENALSGINRTSTGETSPRTRTYLSK